MFLSDTQWLQLKPLFPSTSRGRPSLDNRPILEYVILKLTTHQPWYDLPSTSPSWQTCYQHYHRWQCTGTWRSIINILLSDLNDRGGVDLPRLWDSHEFTIKRESDGKLAVAYPPQLEGTWQLSTAILILQLLSSQ